MFTQRRVASLRQAVRDAGCPGQKVFRTSLRITCAALSAASCMIFFTSIDEQVVLAVRGTRDNDDAAAYLSRGALQVSCAQEVHFLT